MRNSGSRPSGSGRNAMRVSAQTLSHNSQAWDMFLTSFSITVSVVRRRRTVSWVKRQKKNCFSLERSNHRSAFSKCTCRLHNNASQTFASRKFNAFIYSFVSQIYLWSFGDDQWEADSLCARALAIQESCPDARQDELPNRASLRR